MRDSNGSLLISSTKTKESHRKRLRWTFPPEDPESPQPTVPLRPTDTVSAESGSAPPVQLTVPVARSVETACEPQSADESERSKVRPLLEVEAPPQASSPAPAAIGPSSEADPTDPSSSSSSATSTVPAPGPRRTRFSICLQLGRGFASLVALVRAAAEANSIGAREASHSVARHILRGARDRSRDRHLRPLLDHQRRTGSLSQPRPARRRRPTPTVLASAPASRVKNLPATSAATS